MKEIEQALADMAINKEMEAMPVINSEPSIEPEPKMVQGSQQPIDRLGPRYLAALDKVTSLADVKSVTVQLPISMDKVTVSPMTGAEEQVIRSKSSDPETFMASVNKLLYDHSTYTSRPPLDFDDFLKNLYPHDKTMMIWALLAATYSTLPSMDKQCDKCGELYEVKLQPGDLLKPDGMPIPWEEDQSPEDFVLRKSIMDGAIIFEISLPNEEKRMQIASLFTAEQMKHNMSQQGSMFTFADNLTYFIKRVIVKDSSGDIILTNPVNDIYPFMTNLPPKIKDLLEDIADIGYFDKYMADFYEMVNCTHCGNQEKIEIMPEIEFFRKALSAY